MVSSAPFVTIDKLGETTGIKSRNTIYKILGEMEKCGRYKHAQLRLDRLVNVLAVEDYLSHRRDLKRKTAASKNLPPFSMHTARQKRGDIA